MKRDKCIIILLLVVFCIILLYLICEEKQEKAFDNSISEEIEVYNKGYDLPIDEEEKAHAKADCLEVMEIIQDIYTEAAQNNQRKSVLTNETIFKMQSLLKSKGDPVSTTIMYSNMENYKKMEKFLEMSSKGEQADVLMYTILLDGGITSKKYTFDGKDMYVLNTNATWNDEYNPVVTNATFNRIKEWEYTENGWFCYKLCVPEYPEVTEVVDGSCLVRVLPISDENRELSNKYVLGLGYKGNNLLCSNWNEENLEVLDYSGMYEYLYEMKYHTTFPSEIYLNGIPKEEFENLIMKYLPISREQLQQYAAFDEVSQTYQWAKLGCGTFNRSFFSTAFPEVVNVEVHDNETITLTVNAVCEMMLCDDAVITHKLTIQNFEDGSFQYLSNRILYNGIEDIPSYQYRIL